MKQDFKSTPFDELIQKVHTDIWTNQKNDPDLIFLAEQLRCLKIIYRSMLSNSINPDRISLKHKAAKTNKKIYIIKINEEAHLNLVEAFLSYIFFIDQIKIMGEYLNKHKIIKFKNFPKYKNIRFFRNIIGQHWQEYTNSIGAGTLLMRKKAISVPVICFRGNASDLKKISMNTSGIYRSFGIPYEAEKFAFNAQAHKRFSNQKKADEFYRKIFQLKIKNNNRMPSRLIQNFFLLGFYAPIVNVEEYSKTMVLKLEQAYIHKEKLTQGIEGGKEPFHYGYFRSP